MRCGDAARGLVPAADERQEPREAGDLEEAVHLGRGVVGKEQHERALELFAVGEPFEQHAHDRRVDEGRLRQVDDERRLAAERGGQVGADPRRRVGVGLPAERDHAEVGTGVHEISMRSFT